MPDITFQIDTITVNNSGVVDHNATTGDDRGGIAVTPDRVFYTGDNATTAVA